MGQGRAEIAPAFSTRIVFFIAGAAVAAWAPLVPFAKARTGVDAGELGMLLLCFGMGSMLTMPLAGALAARLGCRTVIVTAGVLLSLCLPLLAFGSSVVVLVAGLFGFGAGVGALDVSVNIQAIIVEREAGRALMSGFHGFYSLGGIVGAGAATAMLSLGASPLIAAGAVAAGSLIALAIAAPGLLARGGAREGPAVAFPRGIVWLIGALCFIVFLAEGSVQDWSAVFLSSVRGMPRAYAGVGFAAFATAMTAGRLTGDRVVQRFGGANVIVAGGLSAAAGFALTTLAPGWPLATVGYALVGAGCSNIVPVLFTGAGRQTAMPEATAVPAMTTLGYAGILVGPAAIGLVAQIASLPAAFLIVAVLLLAVAACGKLMRV